MEMEGDEWELSKENVQPLRQGRSMACLTAGLQPQSDQAQKIKDEKRAFETELRTYTGDDPLDVWYRYVRWAEQTFPKGGSGSNLTALVERCLEMFKEEEKYFNDERFIYIWLKMASVCDEPLIIFNFMYDKNIGSNLSSFYIGWATCFEELGNTKKANTAYMTGINKNAQPIETLKQRHDEFQKRVARMVIEGHEFVNQDEPVASGPLGQSAGQEQRQALSQLRSVGKKHMAPVNRTGSAVLGNTGGLGGARPKAAQQKPLQIYQDENQPLGSMAAPTNEWKAIPNRDVTNKENEKKPGPWNKQKLPKSGVNIPVSSLSTCRQPSFSVHVDESDPTIRTPAKNPDIGHQVLSARKEKPTSTIDYLRGMTANPNKNEKPMYCKEKVYGGIEEFSFEELRAYKWKKKQEELKKEEEIKGMKQYFEEERRRLQEEADRVKNERLKMEQKEAQMIQEACKKLKEQQQRMEQEQQRVFERQQEMIEQTIQRRIQEQMSTSNSFSRASNSGEVQQVSDVSTSSEMMARMNISRNRQEQLNSSRQSPDSVLGSNPSSAERSRSEQLHNSRPTPDSFMGSKPSSGDRLRSEQVTFGAASPTVNTKEALKLVRGMFNSSPESNTTGVRQGAMDQGHSQQAPSNTGSMGCGGQAEGGMSFQIFNENQNMSGRQQTQSAATPFTVFDENNSRAEPQTFKHQNQSNSAPFTIFDENQGRALSQPSKQQNQSSAPFSIFDDNQGKGEPQGFKQSSEPFSIFNEKKDGQQSKKSKRLPFGILQDEETDTSSPCEENTPMITSPVQPSALSVTQRSTRKGSSLFDEENMESIESHARDDITLAPLGSHLSFAAAAKFASTPFNKSKVTEDSSSMLNTSDIEMPEIGQQSTEQKTENETSRSINASNPTNQKGLSPIMEGSSEDSGASSKSGQQSFMTRHVPTLTTIDGTPGNISTPGSYITPEDTMALLQLRPLNDANNSNTHVIDVSTYIPPDMDEKTENFLSMSICLYDPKDPFDSEMKDKILSNLKEPLSMYNNYEDSNECLPDIRKGSMISLGMGMYKIIAKIGQGGFAKVFVAQNESDMTFDFTGVSSKEAVKVEEPCQFWEFYICHEVHKRLAALSDSVDIRPAMMKVNAGWFFRNGSILITDYHHLGTLLDLANLYKKAKDDDTSDYTEPMSAYMTIELLHMVEKLHKCQIIHGDIKPDNFLFLEFPTLPNSTNPVEVFSGNKRFAQLIDFGQSIDMSKYKSGTTFTTKVTTQCFQCTEMKTNRPWTYQTDYFGLAGTIHVLVFKQYMNVYQSGQEWKMTCSFHRNWNTELWKRLFHILLNVPSCDELPDLSIIRREFEDYFVNKLLTRYNSICNRFNGAVAKSRQEHEY